MTAWLTPGRARAALLLLLALFVGVGAWCFAGPAMPRGDDLASSYLGCRLLAHGQAAHLFSYDEDQFSDTGDDDSIWSAEADAGGYSSYYHPYVQTPLWAWALRPLCLRPWPTFERTFNLLALLAYAGCAWLAAGFVARTQPRLALFGTALLLPWLWISQPFQYAMLLGQTHILFLLLTLAAFVLAARDRPLLAGASLALAAAVKVTPLVVVLYWLVGRRWRAAASAVACSALLLAAGYLATGPALMGQFFATLHRIAGVLLLSLNNQSLASWSMGHLYPASAADAFTQYPLPAVVRLGSLLLLAALAAAGGWLDRQPSSAPAGAMVTLLAATVCAPIAWTHYAVVLYAPLFVLLAQGWTVRKPWVWAAAAVVGALNVPPFTPDFVHLLRSPLAPTRPQFYACVLAMAALLATGLALRRRRPHLPSGDVASSIP